MSKELEALERILDYVNLDEYDYETKGLRNAEMLLKQALTKLEQIEKIIKKSPSNGYFESVRDCIDKYNEIKNLLSWSDKDE